MRDRATRQKHAPRTVRPSSLGRFADTTTLVAAVCRGVEGGVALSAKLWTGRPTRGESADRVRNSSVYIGGPFGLNDIAAHGSSVSASAPLLLSASPSASLPLPLPLHQSRSVESSCPALGQLAGRAVRESGGFTQPDVLIHNFWIHSIESSQM